MKDIMSLFPDMDVEITQKKLDEVANDLGRSAVNSILQAHAETFNNSLLTQRVSLRNRADCMHDAAFSIMSENLKGTGAIIYNDSKGNRKRFFVYKDIAFCFRNADNDPKSNKVQEAIKEQSLSRPVVFIEYTVSAMKDCITRIAFVYSKGATYFEKNIALSTVAEVEEQPLTVNKPSFKKDAKIAKSV